MRYDRQSKATILISVGPEGGPAAGSAWAPSISGDGNRVAFVSDGGDTVVHEADRRAGPDLRPRHRRQAHDPRLEGLRRRAPARAPSDEPAISQDGTQVAFTSAASNLVDGFSSQFPEVYRRNLAAGQDRRGHGHAGGPPEPGRERLPVDHRRREHGGVRVRGDRPRAGGGDVRRLGRRGPGGHRPWQLGGLPAGHGRGRDRPDLRDAGPDAGGDAQPAAGRRGPRAVHGVHLHVRPARAEGRQPGRRRVRARPAPDAGPQPRGSSTSGRGRWGSRARRSPPCSRTSAGRRSRSAAPPSAARTRRTSGS